jgi:hypothetical protein
MAQTARNDSAETINQATADVAAGAKKQYDAFANAQSEFFGKCQEASRYWLDRMSAEAKLASEFTANLSAAHSIPDAMTAWQEWTSRHLEMMAEDTKHLMNQAQMFVQNGSKGLGIST